MDYTTYYYTGPLLCTSSRPHKAISPYAHVHISVACETGGKCEKQYDGSEEGSEGMDKGSYRISDEPYNESHDTKEGNKGEEEDSESEDSEDSDSSDEEYYLLELREVDDIVNPSWDSPINDIWLEKCESYEEFGGKLHEEWSKYVEQEEYLVNPQPHNSWPRFKVRFLKSQMSDEDHLVDVNVYQLSWQNFRQQVGRAFFEEQIWEDIDLNN